MAKVDIIEILYFYSNKVIGEKKTFVYLIGIKYNKKLLKPFFVCKFKLNI